MHKRGFDALEFALDHIRPFCDHWAQLRIELGVRPLLVLRFACAEPRRPWLRQALCKIDLVVAFDEPDIARVEQQVETLGGIRANGDGVSGVDDGVVSRCVNDGERCF